MRPAVCLERVPVTCGRPPGRRAGGRRVGHRRGPHQNWGSLGSESVVPASPLANQGSMELSSLWQVAADRELMRRAKLATPLC